MWARSSLIGLGGLIIQSACFNLYLYELFLGEWHSTQAKAFFYITSAFILLARIIEDCIGYKSNYQFQFNIISKVCFVANFILFFLALDTDFNNPIIYISTFNGSVFAISAIVFTSGLKHGLFD